MRYGDYSLKRGDHDGTPAINGQTGQAPVWGGALFNPPAPVQLATAQTPQVGGATLAIPAYVEDLQRDLRELGFLVIKGNNANGAIDDGYVIRNPKTTPSGVAGENIGGKFGLTTEWAVKEFQIYASMENVAQLNLDVLHTLTGNNNAGETAWSVAHRGMVPTGTALPEGSTPHPVSYYVATLRQITNAHRYTGPISGVVNQETRRAIAHWIENRYRCPVVIEVWNKNASGQRTTLVANGANIWHMMEIPTSGPWIYFRDFTDYYTYPEGHTPARDQYQIVGRIVPYAGVPAGGKNYLGSQTWSSAEILPQRLINTATTIETLQLPANIEAATASTYRVVRAISEVECEGQFDGFNAYDRALFSMGICHWTLGLGGGNSYIDAELAGLFAYFFHSNPEAYREAIGRYGLYPQKLWNATNRHQASTTPTGMFMGGSQKKYAGWYRQHTDAIGPDAAQANPLQLPEVSRQKKEADYYKTWHWIFRWVMAGRTNEAFRHVQWDVSRMRIQDILGHRLTLPAITITPVAQGATPQPVQINLNNRTLGEIFTSEKAVAYLFRIHVNSPGSATTAEPTPYSNTLPPQNIGESDCDQRGRAAKAIRMAIVNNPNLPNWNNPALWTNAHETVLTESLYTWGRTANTSVRDTMLPVRNWRVAGTAVNTNYQLRFQLGALRTARNSFHFDTTGI